MATEVTSTKKKLVIIDGKSVFYRGYYAMSNLTTKDGTPTGGVFGFATMALEVIRRLGQPLLALLRGRDASRRKQGPRSFGLGEDRRRAARGDGLPGRHAGRYLHAQDRRRLHRDGQCT